MSKSRLNPFESIIAKYDNHIEKSPKINRKRIEEEAPSPTLGENKQKK